METNLTKKEIGEIEEVLKNIDGIIYEEYATDYPNEERRNDYSYEWDFYCKEITLSYCEGYWTLVENSDIFELTSHVLQEIHAGLWYAKEFDDGIELYKSYERHGETLGCPLYLTEEDEDE